MKIGLLIIGILVAIATYFLLPSLSLPSYAAYVGYGLAAVLVLMGLFGKKKF